MPDRVTILGVPVDALTETLAIDQIDRFVQSKKPHQIITVNAEFLVAAQSDHGFREILHQSSLNTADGIGVLWAAKYLSIPLLGSKVLLKSSAFLQLVLSGLAVVFSPKYIRSVIPEKISGTDLIWPLADLAERRGYSVFLLGGFEDTPYRVADALVAKFPKLKIVGVYSGSPEENGIIDLVKSVRTDILLVAFGPVRQEKWIARNLEKLGVSVAIGLGGTFDYIAGKKPFAPNFLRHRGLEWAFRLVTQPKRLFRVIKAVPVFSRLVYRSKLLQSKPFRKNAVACLVNEKNQILICHRKDHAPVFGESEHWQLPQGGVNEGEGLEAGFRREIFEEVGIKKLEVLGMMPDAHYYDWPIDLAENMYSAKYRGQAQSIFYARVGIRQPIKLDDREFDAYRWVNKEEIILAIHPFRKGLVNLVVNNFDSFVK